jgi:hypothetical protein
VNEPSQNGAVTKIWKQDMHINYFLYDLHSHVLEPVRCTTEQYTNKSSEEKLNLRQSLSPAYVGLFLGLHFDPEMLAIYSSDASIFC